MDSLWVALLAALLLAGAGCLEDPPERTASEEGLTSSAAAPADSCGPRPDREAQGEDWSKETLRLAVAGAGGFTLDLPLPVSPQGTQPADWLANAQAPEGWTAILHAMPDGQVLRVSGEGAGTLVSCSIQPQADRGNGCCAEQYLDARWTGTSQGRSEMQSLPVEVSSGEAGLEVHYEAASNWCGAEAGFAGRAEGPGRHPLPGEHMAWCS